MKNKKITIGVFGHYGNRNLGDEAIIEAVIQNFRKRLQEVIICGFSIVPEDTQQRHSIESFPIRYRHTEPIVHEKDTDSTTSEKRSEYNHSSFHKKQGQIQKLKNLIKKIPYIKYVLKAPVYLLKALKDLSKEISFLIVSYKRVRKLDVLMITGSNQFLDNFGGPWGFPYTLLKWSVLAKLAGTKVFIVSLGAGPISHKLSKLLIRWTLRCSDYVSLRNVSSEKLIADIGCKKALHVFPDIAHSLEIGHIKASALPSKVITNGSPVIGINPMPLYDPRYWCEKDGSKYQNYVSKLENFCNRLVAADYPFYFFATQSQDNNVIYDILHKLEVTHNKVFDFAEHTLVSSSVEGLIANIAVADITVATRFHGTVLSLLSEKPMLGICYHKKSKELLVDMGQGEYAVDLDSFTVDSLWEKFTSLVANFDIEKEKIQRKNERYLDSLDQQYNNLIKKAVG